MITFLRKWENLFGSTRSENAESLLVTYLCLSGKIRKFPSDVIIYAPQWIDEVWNKYSECKNIITHSEDKRILVKYKEKELFEILVE
jgi:hypothetical protein